MDQPEKNAQFRRRWLSQFLLVLTVGAWFFLFWQWGGFAESLVRHGNGNEWLAQTYRALSLEKYWPTFFSNFPSYGPLSVVRWALGLLPAAIVLAFISLTVLRTLFALFLSPPKRSIIDHEGYDLRTKGTDLPPIEHLNHALAVCPDYDRALLVEDLFLGDVPLEAPAQSMVTIKEEGHGQRSDRA